MNLVELFQEIKRLHSSPASPRLVDYLSRFREPKDRSLETLKEGIRQFVALANLPVEERNDYFGSPLSGLHYDIRLAEVCNIHFLNEDCKIKSFQTLWSICPEDCWKWCSSRVALARTGDLPASIALNKLLQGPTVIDCGMFCQLAILFAIRYMLGDEVFDAIMEKIPFSVTKYCYPSSSGRLTPDDGNPLVYSFLMQSDLVEQDTSEVKITYVPNHKDYSLKHPGGNDMGHNCILVDGNYALFDPTAKKSFNLGRDHVAKLLCESFNSDQDIFDQTELTNYKKYSPYDTNYRFSMNYLSVIERSAQLAKIKLELEQWKLEPITAKKPTAAFDFDKFISWVDDRLQAIKLNTSTKAQQATLSSQDKGNTFPFWEKKKDAEEQAQASSHYSDAPKETFSSD